MVFEMNLADHEIEYTLNKNQIDDKSKQFRFPPGIFETKKLENFRLKSFYQRT